MISSFLAELNRGDESVHPGLGGDGAAAGGGAQGEGRVGAGAALCPGRGVSAKH